MTESERYRRIRQIADALLDVFRTNREAFDADDMPTFRRSMEHGRRLRMSIDREDLPEVESLVRLQSLERPARRV